jgi:hypothetical protein
MDCRHAQDGICLISTALAGMHTPLDERACGACSRSHPQFVNEVTLSRAVYILKKNGRSYHSLLNQYNEKYTKPKSRVKVPPLRERVLARVRRHSHVENWLRLFRLPEDIGLGDTVFRLIEKCARTKKLDLEVELRSFSGKYACKLTDARREMNNVHKF